MPMMDDADSPVPSLMIEPFSVSVMDGEVVLVSGPSAVVMSSAAALELARQLTDAARGLQRA